MPRHPKGGCGSPKEEGLVQQGGNWVWLGATYEQAGEGSQVHCLPCLWSTQLLFQAPRRVPCTHPIRISEFRGRSQL